MATACCAVLDFDSDDDSFAFIAIKHSSAISKYYNTSMSNHLLLLNLKPPVLTLK